MWFKNKDGIEYKVLDQCIGNKMTREEASEKVAKAYSNGPDTGLSFVTALEALGLLKFEEKKTPKYITVDHYGGSDGVSCTVAVNEVILALRRIGIQCVQKT